MPLGFLKLYLSLVLKLNVLLRHWWVYSQELEYQMRFLVIRVVSLLPVLCKRWVDCFPLDRWQAHHIIPSATGLWSGSTEVSNRRWHVLCDEKPKDWDRYGNPLLCFYRETPQDSLGFSPFELLYGRTVRGLLAILKELWTGDVAEQFWDEDNISLCSRSSRTSTAHMWSGSNRVAEISNKVQIILWRAC